MFFVFYFLFFIFYFLFYFQLFLFFYLNLALCLFYLFVLILFYFLIISIILIILIYYLYIILYLFFILFIIYNNYNLIYKLLKFDIFIFVGISEDSLRRDPNIHGYVYDLESIGLELKYPIENYTTFVSGSAWNEKDFANALKSKKINFLLSILFIISRVSIRYGSYIVKYE